MPVFEHLYLAVLTQNKDDAGTSETLNLTVNIDGEDVLDRDFAGDLDDGAAYLFTSGQDLIQFESAGVTNSSIRLGIRGDDAWAPQHALLFGRIQADFSPGRIVALAVETDLTRWMSADSSEGRLTIPLRLVSTGGGASLIRRVLLVINTLWQTSGVGSGTDSPVELEIVAGGTLVLKQQLPDTPQPDLERGETNWYELDASVPFTRADVLSNGRITLRILGADRWRPMVLFLFGLDTATGRPNEVVTLVAIEVLTLGWLSTDPSEGVDSVDLPLVSA